jgi:uncharacterized membrane protein
LAKVQPITVRAIHIDQPMRWLVLGWRDIARAGWVSFAHGLALCVFGWLLLAAARQHFWLLAGAFSGFMVVAPVLATGLYAMSRAIEQGKKPDFQLVMKTWLSWREHGRSKGGKDWRLVWFGLLLGLAATGWVLTSAALITLMAPVPIHNPLDFLRFVVLSPDSYLFEIWLALGGMMAAPMFASSAIALPLLLDRRLSVLDAVITSWQTVLANPIPMAWWACLIMGFSMLGILSALLGLVFVVPMLGHATWHAYRDLVNASGLPARESHDETR